MRDQKVGKLCAKVRKVNNFAAAGNEGLCPAEDFQIESRQVGGGRMYVFHCRS